MIGTKFYKNTEIDWDAYSKCAEWCNEQQTAFIEDKGEYYECVAIEVPVKTLDELKAEKLTALERAFDERVAGSFICSLGYAMQFNRSDCIAVEGAVKLLDATGETEGYLTDAQDITHYGVSKEQMNAVLVEMMKAYAACHADKQTLRAAINACETAEALDGVAFEWSIDKEEDQ